MPNRAPNYTLQVDGEFQVGMDVGDLVVVEGTPHKVMISAEMTGHADDTFHVDATFENNHDASEPVTLITITYVEEGG